MFYAVKQYNVLRLEGYTKQQAIAKTLEIMFCDNLHNSEQAELVANVTAQLNAYANETGK
jgi:tRNA A22 N-methylase